MIAGEFGTMQVFWSLLFFFGMVLVVWLMIAIFGDIFKSTDLSGWAKAMWCLVVLLLPLFGALAYVVVRGPAMHERSGGELNEDLSRDGIPSNPRWSGAKVMTQ